MLRLLKLTVGRPSPSTNNAQRKTFIENDHFCAQAVFWINSQRAGKEEKKREISESLLSSVTHKCMSQVYQIKYVFLWLYLETVINSFYISFPVSTLLFQEKEIYNFTRGRILKKIIKHAACKHLEKNIYVNSILWGFVKNKCCHNNIIFIHDPTASSMCWGKHFISHSFGFVRFLKLSLRIQNTTLRVAANSTWQNGMNDSNTGVKWAIRQGSITMNILIHDI